MISLGTRPYISLAFLGLALAVFGLRVALGEGKQPVPSADKQAAATKLASEVFQRDYETAKTAPQKSALAKKVLAHGLESTGDPAACFVLLRIALDVASGAGDVETALRAIEETAKIFETDAVKAKADALVKISKAPRSAFDSRLLADQASLVADEAIVADQFDMARTLLNLALPLVRDLRDAAQVKLLSARLTDVTELEKQYQSAKLALETLDKKPDDPTANAAAGRFYCLLKGNWEKGLPMLALGNDAAFRDLAIKDLGDPKDFKEQAALGDAWYDLAVKERGVVRESLLAHAVTWYERCAPQATGLLKTKIENRRKEILLPMFARVQAAVKSKRVVASGLGGNVSGGTPFVDIPADGALLVGLDVAIEDFGGGQFVKAVRPIWLTPEGDKRGDSHGNIRHGVTTVRAKEGFVIAGVTTLGGTTALEGLAVTFMPLKGTGLDARRAYTSGIVGRQGGKPIVLGGTGAPVVGIGGRKGANLDALGLVLAP